MVASQNIEQSKKQKFEQLLILESFDERSQSNSISYEPQPAVSSRLYIDSDGPSSSRARGTLGMPRCIAVRLLRY